MDTVVGLSLTSSSIGWVLVDGHDADGVILDHDDFDVRPSTGLQAVYTSEQASAAVLDAQSAAAGLDQRLHVVGVTWSDESAAEAAMLLETLTDAAFDNIVPVRMHDACEALARAIAPVVDFERVAVCVRDGESTIVVMVDTADGDAQTAVKHVRGGPGQLVRWLDALFERSAWRPGGVVVVGDPAEIERLTAQLQSLPVPVIGHGGAELALARGAALASADSTEFTDAAMLETVNSRRKDDSDARQRPYAGAVTLLAAGAVTFVAAVSLAVGQHLVPHSAPEPARPVAHRAATLPIAEAPARPLAAAPTPAARPAPEPVQQPIVQQPVVAQPPIDPPAAAPAPVPVPPPPVAPPPPEPPNPHPLLTKLLQRLHGQDPDQNPAPPPP